jgi:hypothetical protein
MSFIAWVVLIYSEFYRAVDTLAEDSIVLLNVKRQIVGMA